MAVAARVGQGAGRGPRGIGIAVSAGSSAISSPSLAGVLDPAGPIGAAQRTILFNALTIMLLIVVPTIVATLAFAWWFRASNPAARRLPGWAYSGRIELVTWSIPVLVITFLGGIAWVGSHDLDPYRPIPSGEKPLRVQVVSLDWKWLFVLPDDDVASVNTLVIPAGRPVAFELTSASVMNTFFVPRLGSMIYTMNGMTTRLHLQADAPGSFEGLSGHFSGDGFPGMRFEVRADTGDAFASWIASVRGRGETLDRAAYTRLARQSSDVAPMTYGSVEPDLFEAIVDRSIPPAPGPDNGRPDATVSPRRAEICTPARPGGAKPALAATTRGE